MSDPAWHVRPYRPGDERALIALWTEAFGRPMTEAHWRWKAKGRPSPVENVGIAVGDDDRPIFQFVGIPCPALVLGKPRIIMIGADVLTAPQFRRRGVFTATARRLFDSWRDAGIALVLGMANDRWRSRADALGYERFFPMRWMVRPLHPERILSRKAQVAGLSRMSGLSRVWNAIWDRRLPREVIVRPLESATTAIDELWARAAHNVRTSLVRDRAWVNWRYCDFPDRSYRLTLAERTGAPAGYAAYRVVRVGRTTIVQIPEIFAPDDGVALRALIQDLIARAKSEDAESIMSLAVPGSVMGRALRRAGFLFTRRGWPLEVICLDPALSRDALRDPNGWWLTGGDFDVV